MIIPDLNFSIEGAEALRFAASPHIAFNLKITNNTDQPIHSVILKSQVQIDVSRRQYTAAEQIALADLFGEASRWGETLRSVLWANTTTVISSFEREVQASLQVPCTFDFNVATTKFFASIQQGEVPVSFFFNGTIFYADNEGGLRVVHIPWEKEATYRLSGRVWQDMMNAYYPNTAWLCLERSAFERLSAFKTRHGLPTFEEALAKAMEAAS
jgi:hypothetical protein